MTLTAKKGIQQTAPERFFDEATGLLLFTYKDLIAMEQAGILDENERVELIGGQLYIMTTKPPHAFCVTEMGESLIDAFRKDAKLVSQNPLRLSDDLHDKELPQPDLMLVQRKLYLDHPKPQDIFLLVEVSDSTYNKDKNQKLPLYAASNIREVWIVNLMSRHIEVYTLPKNGEYTQQNSYELTATFAPSTFSDIAKQWLPKEVHQVLDKFNV
jgi:Uma2 family endonuclease